MMLARTEIRFILTCFGCVSRLEHLGQDKDKDKDKASEDDKSYNLGSSAGTLDHVIPKCMHKNSQQWNSWGVPYVSSIGGGLAI